MATMSAKILVCAVICVSVVTGVPVSSSSEALDSPLFMPPSPFVAYDPSAFTGFAPGASVGLDYLAQESALNKAYTKAFTSGIPVGLVVPARMVTPDSATPSTKMSLK